MNESTPAKSTIQTPALSRRETQIMDIVYAAKECSAGDVHRAMPDAPSYSTVRKLLAILVEKGHLKNRESAGKYFYRPTKSRGVAGRSALSRVVQTFYEGSLEKAVAAMLSSRDGNLTDDQLEGLTELINEAKKKRQG